MDLREDVARTIRAYVDREGRLELADRILDLVAARLTGEGALKAAASADVMLPLPAYARSEGKLRSLRAAFAAALAAARQKE